MSVEFWSKALPSFVETVVSTLVVLPPLSQTTHMAYLMRGSPMKNTDLGRK
jgi:hypothetical protein